MCESFKVLVFKTDVRTVEKADTVLNKLHYLFTEHEINFDLEDCDNILRIKGPYLDSEIICKTLNHCGNTCEEI